MAQSNPPGKTYGEKMKDKFNKYCAEVNGWVSCTVSASIGRSLDDTKRFNGEAWSTPPADDKSGCIKFFKDDYNPYDDLNQMAEVVEKLWGGHIKTKYLENYPFPSIPIKQAFRDFIISTMPTPLMEEEK